MVPTDTINSRLTQLIGALNIRQSTLADRLNVSQAYVSKLTRTGTPNDRIIHDICILYNVNEDWLRTGAGGPAAMFNSVSRDNETAELFGSLLNADPNGACASIIRELPRLDSDQLSMVSSFIQMLLAHNPARA